MRVSDDCRRGRARRNRGDACAGGPALALALADLPVLLGAWRLK